MRTAMPQQQYMGCRARTNIPELDEVILLVPLASIAVFGVLQQLHHKADVALSNPVPCVRGGLHALAEGLTACGYVVRAHACTLRETGWAECQCTMLELPHTPCSAGRSRHGRHTHTPSERCCSRRWVWIAQGACRGPASAQGTSSHSLRDSQMSGRGTAGRRRT